MTAAKAWLGGVGLVVGLVGMALERRWIVWVAVGCLGAAFLLRFFRGGSRGPPAALLCLLLVLSAPAAAQQPAVLRVARITEAPRLERRGPVAPPAAGPAHRQRRVLLPAVTRG